MGGCKNGNDTRINSVDNNILGTQDTSKDIMSLIVPKLAKHVFEGLVIGVLRKLCVNAMHQCYLRANNHTILNVVTLSFNW